MDFDIAELAVTWQFNVSGGQLLHREVKAEASEAPLPLPDICIAALKLRRDAQVATRAAAGPAWQWQRQLVSTTRYGTPIEPCNLNRSSEARCAKADVRPITVHDGRRSCGTLLADLDVHPRGAIQILPHVKSSLTMEIYTLASSKQAREALKRLGASLDG